MANLYGLTKRQRVKPEALLPEAVAENRDRRAAPGAVYFAGEKPASSGSDSKGGEVISADKAGASGFLLCSCLGRGISDGDFQLGKTAVGGEDSREDLVVISEVLKLGVGEEPAVAALTSEAGTMLVWVRKSDQFFGMRNGKRAQKDRVKDTEDRGIGSNPQRQSQGGNHSDS